MNSPYRFTFDIVCDLKDLLKKLVLKQTNIKHITVKAIFEFIILHEPKSNLKL